MTSADRPRVGAERRVRLEVYTVRKLARAEARVTAGQWVIRSKGILPLKIRVLRCIPASTAV
jgi:hypothetical protein